MLRIILITIVMTVVMTAGLMPEDATAMDEADCAKQNGVDANLANDQLKAAATDLAINDLPENIQCFNKCLMTKQGVLAADGSLDKVVFIKVVSNGDVTLDKFISDAFDQCLTASASDRTSCNFSVTFTACIVNEFKKMNP